MSRNSIFPGPGVGSRRDFYVRPRLPALPILNARVQRDTEIHQDATSFLADHLTRSRRLS